METIFTFVNEIRDFINGTSITKRYVLLQRSTEWNKLCSSLDVVGDTELALDSFMLLENEIDPGNMFLVIYGALQALYIQQDAVKHLAEALKVEFTQAPVLHHIREIRNDSIGHPTKRGNDKSFCFIQRVGLSRTSLKYMKVDSVDSSRQFLEVNVHELISRQREVLANILLHILNKLKEEEMTHRGEFRDKKLMDSFPPTLTYSFGKIYESIGEGEPIIFGKVNLESIEQCILDFKNGLEERGIKKVDSIEYHLGLLDYPLSELKKFFQAEEPRALNNESAYIFLFFVEKHVEYLKIIAKEIDEKYATDV